MNRLKRRGFTAVEAAIVLGVATPVVVPLLVGASSPVFDRARENARRASCQSNLKQIALGMWAYEQDYDEKLPTVNNAKRNEEYGWADEVQPYIKSTQLYQCPSERHTANVTLNSMHPNFTDYWFNSNLSGLYTFKVSRPDAVILNGDGNDGHDLTNARYNKSSLPPQWVASKSSPVYRHLSGANYSWLDGHVKWYTPQQIVKMNGFKVR